MLWKPSICLALVVAACRVLVAQAAPPEVERDVVFGQVEGVDLTADLYRPSADEPRPGVVLLHGGGWAFGDKAQMAYVGRLLARSGFAAMSVNYRLAPQHTFPAQSEDAAAAVKWMRANGDRCGVRSDWIAAYGYSAGGHLALLVALAEGQPGAADNASAKVEAIVAGGAPCDFRDAPLDAWVLSYWLGASRREAPEVYRQASPGAFVRADAPPIYFFHGESDLLVPITSSRDLFRRLAQAGSQVEFHAVPECGHIATFAHYQAAEDAVAFLKRQAITDLGETAFSSAK